MAENFHVSQTNPNDEVGGGGCVCSDTKQEDCKPPYVIFYVTETDSNISPHVVACQACMESALRAIEKDPDAHVVEGEVVEEEVDDDEVPTI